MANIGVSGGGKPAICMAISSRQPSGIVGLVVTGPLPQRSIADVCIIIRALRTLYAAPSAGWTTPFPLPPYSPPHAGDRAQPLPVHPCSSPLNLYDIPQDGATYGVADIIPCHCMISVTLWLVGDDVETCLNRARDSWRLARLQVLARNISMRRVAIRPS